MPSQHFANHLQGLAGLAGPLLSLLAALAFLAGQPALEGVLGYYGMLLYLPLYRAVVGVIGQLVRRLADRGRRQLFYRPGARHRAASVLPVGDGAAISRCRPAGLAVVERRASATIITLASPPPGQQQCP